MVWLPLGVLEELRLDEPVEGGLEVLELADVEAVLLGVIGVPLLVKHLQPALEQLPIHLVDRVLLVALHLQPEHLVEVVVELEYLPHLAQQVQLVVVARTVRNRQVCRPRDLEFVQLVLQVLHSLLQHQALLELVLVPSFHG